MIIEESNISKTIKKVLPKTILIIVVIGILLLIISKISYSKKEKEIKSTLEKYAIPYYHKYYDQLVKQDNISSLERFVTEGIKIELETISKDNDEVKEKFENCHSKNTIVIIYPESPFTKTDFKTSVEIDCKI